MDERSAKKGRDVLERELDKWGRRKWNKQKGQAAVLER